MTITGDQLKIIIPSMTDERSSAIVGLINSLFPVYGITNRYAVAAFLANLVHESNGFSSKSENMNYTASRIVAVWPSRFKTVVDAQPFARNPEALANKVYGGRMGNRLPNDGWLFRGAGFIQLTGREMFFAYQKYIDFDSTEKLAITIRTDDYYAMDSACWIYAIAKDLVKLSEKQQFKEVCHRINGGYIGYDERLLLYNKILKILK